MSDAPEESSGRHKLRAWAFTVLIAIPLVLLSLFSTSDAGWVPLVVLLPLVVGQFLTRRRSRSAILVLVFIAVVVGGSMWGFFNTRPESASWDNWLALAKAEALVLFGCAAIGLLPTTIRKGVVLGLTIAALGWFLSLTTTMFRTSRGRKQFHITCSSYALNLSYARHDNGFRSHEDIVITMSGLEPDYEGLKNPTYHVPSSTRATLLVERWLSYERATGWHVSDASTARTGDGEVVVAQLTRDQPVPAQRIGLITYIAQIYPPNVNIDATTKVKYTVMLPENVTIKHNLAGEFKPTLLASGEDGSILSTASILGDERIVRLKYIRSFFYRPGLNVLLNLSSSSIVLWLLSLLGAVLSYLGAVFRDIIKDERVKPFASTVLQKLRLVRSPAPIVNEV